VSYSPQGPAGMWIIVQRGQNVSCGPQSTVPVLQSVRQSVIYIFPTAANDLFLCLCLVSSSVIMYIVLTFKCLGFIYYRLL